jgi:pimeloyl-ACP methyl ester carboxylesterase
MCYMMLCSEYYTKGSAMTPTLHSADLECGAVSMRVFGTGPLVVFNHGLAVDGRLWDPLIPHLPEGFTYALPDWPLGSHRLRARSVALGDIADSIAALPSALGFKDAVFVGNDSGGGMTQIALARRPEVFRAVVFTSCDAFEQFPPAILAAIKPMAYAPGLLALFLRLFAYPAFNRMPLPMAWLTKRDVPAALLKDWQEPLWRDRAIRKDACDLIKQVNRTTLVEAAKSFAAFDRPVLVAWSADDFVFRPKLGKRLAAAFRNARYTEIPDARTFSMIDNPQALGREIGAFLMETTPVPA